MAKRLRSQGKRQQLHSIIEKLRGACETVEDSNSESEISQDNLSLAHENGPSVQTKESFPTEVMSKQFCCDGDYVENRNEQNQEKDTLGTKNCKMDKKDAEHLSLKGKTPGKKGRKRKISSQGSAKSVDKRKGSYACDHCGAILSRSDLLKRHMLIHTDLKPFQCMQCGRFFRNKSGLQVHTRSHTGERPYSCSICGKGFRKSSDLTRHGIVHTGARPAICTYCGRGFRDTFQLNIHTRTHTGEKPYKCGVCGKTFSRSDNMQEHERKHSGWKKYRCSICTRGYALRKSFINHMKKHELAGNEQNINQTDELCSNNSDNNYNNLLEAKKEAIS